MHGCICLPVCLLVIRINLKICADLHEYFTRGNPQLDYEVIDFGS